MMDIGVHYTKHSRKTRCFKNLYVHVGLFQRLERLHAHAYMCKLSLPEHDDFMFYMILCLTEVCQSLYELTPLRLSSFRVTIPVALSDV
jgi:hypothetical protein